MLRVKENKRLDRDRARLNEYLAAADSCGRACCNGGSSLLVVVDILDG